MYYSTTIARCMIFCPRKKYHCDWFICKNDVGVYVILIINVPTRIVSIIIQYNMGHMYTVVVTGIVRWQWITFSSAHVCLRRRTLQADFWQTYLLWFLFSFFTLQNINYRMDTGSAIRCTGLLARIINQFLLNVVVDVQRYGYYFPKIILLYPQRFGGTNI